MTPARARGGGPAGGPLTSRLVAVAAVVVILFGVHAIASIVSLVLLSVLATVLLAPLAAALRRRGVPAGVALLASLAVYVGVLAVAGLIVAVGLAGFLGDLPTYEDELAVRLAEIGIALGGAGAPPPLDAAAVADAVRGLAREIVGMLTTIGYSVIVVAYLLLEAPRAGDRLREAFGPDTEVVARGAALADRLRTYLVARAALGGIAAILDTILLVVLGIPAAALWGVLSFLLSFIPNVGFIVALVPPAVLGFLTGGVGLGLAVIVGYSVINVAIDYAVQPRFIGSSVDLAPVVVTICLLFWAVVLGPAGALLAVPATIVAAASFDAFEGGRPVARLLGEGPKES